MPGRRSTPFTWFRWCWRASPRTGSGSSPLVIASDHDTPTRSEISGHEPNGYLWEGVAHVHVITEAPAPEGRFSYDPEGGMFCAHGRDRSALDELGIRMAAIATDAERSRCHLTGRMRRQRRVSRRSGDGDRIARSALEYATDDG
ncbi:Imm51 family immunity protein [Microtetraspora malaysiensis]|uniref:Imm51 family immunity protein n=1 Tax=Microtetraspora malaysiensis TaxID=161358 RepID=UPI003D90FAB7